MVDVNEPILCIINHQMAAFREHSLAKYLIGHVILKLLLLTLPVSNTIFFPLLIALYGPEIFLWFIKSRFSSIKLKKENCYYYFNCGLTLAIVDHCVLILYNFIYSVLLRQNPHNVHEWHKRVTLFKDKPREVRMSLLFCIVFWIFYHSDLLESIYYLEVNNGLICITGRHFEIWFIVNKDQNNYI